jgi:hypothetical protein
VDRVVLWRRGRRPRRAGQPRDSVFVFSDAGTTSRLIGEEAALARATTPAHASGGGGGLGEGERGRGRAGKVGASGTTAQARVGGGGRKGNAFYFGIFK